MSAMSVVVDLCLFPGFALRGVADGRILSQSEKIPTNFEIEGYHLRQHIRKKSKIMHFSKNLQGGNNSQVQASDNI